MNISSIVIPSFLHKYWITIELENYIIRPMFAVHYSKKNWNSGDSIRTRWNRAAGLPIAHIEIRK